jgi:hypothetical protein
LVRQYDLSYTNGFSSINLLLSSITESGMDESHATTTLPAATFEYNDGFDPVWTLDTTFATSALEYFVLSGSVAGDGIWKDNSARMMDINGDGYVDQVYGRDPNRYAILNDGDGTWTGPPNSWSTPWYFLNSSHQDTGLRIIDANGDGLPDL